MKIYYKNTIIFCTAIAILLLSIFIYLNSFFKNYTYNRIQNNLIKEISLIENIINRKTANQQISEENIDKIIQQTGNILQTRITLISTNGKVISDSELNTKQTKILENHINRPEIQIALKDKIGISQRFSTTIQTNMLYIAKKIQNQNFKGIIRLAIALSDIAIISKQLKKTLLISLLIALIIGGFISLIISFFISKPIETITNMAQQIAKGDYSKKTIINTNDEISILAKSFNNMAKQINIKINEITEHKTKLETILLNMFDGVIVVDLKGKIILINDSLKKTLSINQSPIGKNFIEILRNLEIQKIIEQVISIETEILSKEINIFMEKEQHFVINGTSLMNNNEKQGAVFVFHNITKIKNLEKIRKDFIANVSHELRTPITNIKGFSETLYDGALKDTKNAKHFLEIIKKNSDNLVKLIDNLLDLSKIESNNNTFNFGFYPIYNICQKAIHQLNNKAIEKKIKIKNQIKDNIKNIYLDEYMIYCVFINLIENAIKYTNNNGTIEIKNKENKETIEISIQDNGIGIPKKDIKRIFERFYRVDKARSKESGGTGLGLSIVKNIIEKHNGIIFVTSEENKGSCFTFILPKKM